MYVLMVLTLVYGGDLKAIATHDSKVACAAAATKIVGDGRRVHRQYAAFCVPSA